MGNEEYVCRICKGKHWCWLNAVECEFSVLSRQILSKRISNIGELVKEVKQWQRKRNRFLNHVDWQFTSEDARVKLKQLYPRILA